ncbi:rhomboid family intramembrane serine protease [Thermococcus chitonophagus]|uniref:Rhomboid family intramembrane serine protease n=1 Tax=Thermococcus chitonophagus TaxID=54262 RepID=A0A160VUH6_9EURY|nr:rhomboid family intramembrane serine protease [Thermococcus chitonophagus]ASJ17002.1 rhomboid family intramembrane serine protease [Thermococcus chitonophagus]CUX78489.1 Rhomboid family protein [Thermococcus chitonophagus]
MKKVWKYFPGTLTLLVLITLVFAYELIVGFNRAIFQLAQINFLVLYKGEWWRLITAIFVHMGFVHFALNAFWLFYLGIDLEGVVGTKRFLAVFFISALVGNVLSLFTLPLDVASGGASGGLFGIVGASLAIEGVLRRNMSKALMNALFLFLINSIFPGVNIIAHFGGLATGLALGYTYGKWLKRKLIDMSYWSFV